MELYELNLWMLVEGLKSKKFSASEIFESCKKRIDECEGNIHALITRTDSEMPEFSESGELAGIPAVIKDNLCTKGIRTTAASKILGSWKPPYDATAWSKLKEAGAVLMGKANMDEFAMGNTCGNSAFGPTRNPNDISRVPGGSSGGSAAAVSAGYVPFSLGSDTGGSIRQPASFCGVYGFKPTYGMVSRYGLISYGSSLDQIGPFARTVRDLQIVMSIISGHDPMDSSSFRDKAHDFTHSENVSLKGKRVAIVKEFQNFTLDAPIADAMKRTLKVLEEEGAVITEVSLPVVAKYAVGCYYALAMSEAHTNLERYDGVRLGYTVKDARGIKEMFERVRSEGFGSEVKARIIAGTCLTEPTRCEEYYVAATKVRTLIAQEFTRAFGETDYILQPVTPSLPGKVGESDDDAMKGYEADLYTLPVNLAGLPGLSFFTGYAGCLPVGLQLIGPRWSDAGLLDAGIIFERHLGGPKIANGGLATA
ncbi:MAG: Asp-tRNA(Asn)/Glu-tRNA(Gln) amidotransferase subunit GatA [Synergistaceae bacterium]|nr:Asp-tRNA(Asn)/Glu-tRNA(Gln) amidotransferase subunit GatA [Synergistaceae bacterium]MBQ6919673.1 Asp-tRNA(Asn)/Glu-tRNA(Gln) amidotransferase subunit GatA [Synergistaceae bacterium]